MSLSKKVSNWFSSLLVFLGSFLFCEYPKLKSVV